MPVSLLLEDALKGFGVQAGLHRVVSSEWTVHQFPPNKEGKQSEPFVCWAIGYQPIDPAGKPIGDVQIDTSMRVAPKFGESLDKSKFAPAASLGQPLPLRVGSKGYFLEPIADQSGLYEGSKPMLFLKQLFSVGFDKQRLIASGMSVGILVGTEGDIFELVSQNDGTDDSGKQFKPTKIPAFKSIRKFGYESGTVATMPAAGATAAAVAPNGAPAVNGSAVNLGDVQGTAVALLKEIAKQLTGTTQPTAEVAKKVLAAAQKLDPKPHPDVRNAAKELLKSPDFYALPGLDDVAIIEGDNVTFA